MDLLPRREGLPSTCPCPRLVPGVGFGSVVLDLVVSGPGEGGFVLITLVLYVLFCCSSILY